MKILYQAKKSRTNNKVLEVTEKEDINYWDASILLAASIIDMLGI